IPSSSRMSVSARAQISRSRCQSVELRARRETSSPITSPTRPRPTSATNRWNPLRSTAEAPGQPEILVDHDDLLRGPPERVRSALEVVLPGRTLTVVMHLGERGLSHVEI